MGIRSRKFLGILLTIFWMALYALVMMAVGANYIVGRGMVIELPFYILAGLAWLPVEMTIIRWMSRPDLH